MKKRIRGLCAIILVLGVLFSVTSCNLFDSLNSETEETTTAATKTELTNDLTVLAGYFNTVFEDSYTLKPAVKATRTLDAKDIEFVKRGQNESDGSFDLLNAASGQAKKYIMTEIKNIEIKPVDTSAYGEDISTVLPDYLLRDFSELNNAKVELDGDTYKVTVTLDNIDYPAPADSKIHQLFQELDIDKAFEEFEKTKEYLALGDKEDVKLSYRECQIYFETDRVTDNIKTLSIIKNVYVVAPITGQGSLSDYGEMDIIFKLVDTTRYDFDWTDPNATTIAAEA